MFGKKQKTDKADDQKIKEKKKRSHVAKKEKKVEEPQYYRTATNIQALNYRVYVMSMKEKVCYTLIAFMVGAIVGYVFYGGLMKDDLGRPTIYTYGINTIIMLLTGLVFAKIFIPIRTESLKNSRQNKLKSQFRDMLESLATSLGSGRNVTDAFAAAYEDLGNQYEATAFILKELFIINVGMANGFNIEELLADFSRRSGCEDIENFANVFEICYRRGGNIKDTVRNTCDIISDKMMIVESIDTVVAASKSELSLMLVFPILMCMLLKGSSPELAANFSTPAGIISTTVALVFVLIAYVVGKKILDIKV